MATITEKDVKAQMLRDKRAHRVSEIAPHSTVVLEDGRVGYLEKNTGGNPWVILDPGELAIEVDKHDRLEVLVTPCELAQDWMAQTDVLDPYIYGDATSELLAACKLGLTACDVGNEQPGLQQPNIFSTTAKLLSAAITKFERTRK